MALSLGEITWQWMHVNMAGLVNVSLLLLRLRVQSNSKWPKGDTDVHPDKQTRQFKVFK